MTYLALTLAVLATIHAICWYLDLYRAAEWRRCWEDVRDILKGDDHA